MTRKVTKTHIYTIKIKCPWCHREVWATDTQYSRHMELAGEGIKWKCDGSDREIGSMGDVR